MGRKAPSGWSAVKADPLRAAAYRQRNRARMREWRRTAPVEAMLTRARGRARRRGVPFDLQPEDVVIPARCPIFGEPLRRAAGKPDDWSPELDRIEPARGYVRGNVIVISRRANRIKNDATIGELLRLAAFFDALYC
jgi:hypothetical protein